MSFTATEYDLADLLRRVGAQIHGHSRADCPRCKRQRSVSFDESRGIYHCHGQGCDFSGSAARLARELGLARQLSGAEYRELRQNRERADRAARALYARVKARRFELLEELRGLGRLEVETHTAGANHPVTWGALALAYTERPFILAKLAILENASAADVIRFLAASPEQQATVTNRAIMEGGVYDPKGRFYEVQA